MIQQKYTALFYGEGKKEKNFLFTLTSLDKFKFHTEKKWEINIANASGGSAEEILRQCKNSVTGIAYSLVMCFVDIDLLKKNSPKNWKEEKERLENKYKEITIIWQFDDLEEELSKVIGTVIGKHKTNQLAKKRINEFINSDYWKRILTAIKAKEQQLEKNNTEE